MATATMSRIDAPTNLSGRELALAACEVRVWGMDADDKPFIQTATARHITEKGALLTGVLPVRMGETIGIKYLDRKGRFKVSWISDPDMAQTRSIGVECLEDKNIWGMRIPIPIEHHSSAYADSKSADSKANRRKAERFTCRVAADITLDNAVAQAHAWVSDISRKGCYLQMISPFAAGSGVALSVYVDDQQQSRPLVLRGVVRTCHPMVGMGVEFTDVNDAHLQDIQRVLEQLAGPKPPKAEQASAAWTAPPGAQSAVSTATGTFSVKPLQTAPADTPISEARTIARRISMDIQRLESDIVMMAGDGKAIAEVRQAALHMRNVWHLCAASQKD